MPVSQINLLIKLYKFKIFKLKSKVKRTVRFLIIVKPIEVKN